MKTLTEILETKFYDLSPILIKDPVTNKDILQFIVYYRNGRKDLITNGIKELIAKLKKKTNNSNFAILRTDVLSSNTTTIGNSMDTTDKLLELSKNINIKLNDLKINLFNGRKFLYCIDELVYLLIPLCDSDHQFTDNELELIDKFEQF